MNKLLTILLILLLAACSNKEDRARALKNLDASQIALANVKNEILRHEKLLTENLGELEVAKDNMNQVKQFVFLRSEAERERDIRKATEYKLKIEKNIETINSNIKYFQDSVFRTEREIVRLTEFLKN